MKKNILLFALSAALTVGCIGFVASCADSSSADDTAESSAQIYEQTASTEATTLAAGDTVTSYAASDDAVVHMTGKIAANTQVSAVSGATTKGVAISFFLSGATSDWSAVVNADNYKLTYGNLDPYWSTGACANTNCYPSASAFGGDWQALLNTDNAHVIINVNSNGVTFYKNGEKVFFYGANEYMAGSTTVKVSQFISGFLSAVESGGFIFQEVEYNINELYVNYAVSSDSEAAALYESQNSDYNDKVSVTVRYVYEDGTTAKDAATTRVSSGEGCTIESPVIWGYTADQKTVSLTNVTKDTTVTVTYVASTTAVETTKFYGTLKNKEIDVQGKYTAETGVSISFMLSGATSDWGPCVNAGNYKITYANLDSYWTDGACAGLNCYPSATAYGGTWNALLNTSNAHVLINVLPDGITFYLNGEKAFYYGADETMAGSSVKISEFIDGFFEAFATDTFWFNGSSYEAKNLVVGGGLTAQQAQDRYMDEAGKVKVVYNYVDDNGATLQDSTYKFINKGGTYSLSAPYILGYLPVQSTVSGTADESLSVDVVYNTCNVYTYTINFVYEDGTTAADSVSFEVNESCSYSITAPYISGYMPERESYTFRDASENTTYNVVYSECGDNVFDIFEVGTISSAYSVTVPENITLETGMTVTFLVSGATSDWDALLTTDAGYNVTYGNLDSWSRNSHHTWPSNTAYGGDNWSALLSSEEVFVAVTIRSDSVTFYANGQKVIQYAATDMLDGGTYDYYVGDWVRNMFNAMLSDGFYVQPQSYHMRRLTVSTALSDSKIARIYEDIKETYSAELVVKYICAEDNNRIIGEERWYGTGIAYSITPPELLGYKVKDSSVISGRAENGRTNIYIYYEQTGIATLNIRYVDTAGNELQSTVTEQVTIPSIELTAPEIKGYVAVNDYEARWTMKHGETYTITFVYEYHTHSYVSGVCSICGEACSHSNANGGDCPDCGGVLTTTAQSVSVSNPGAWVWILGNQTVEYGNVVSISGTETGTMANNWSTIYFELSEGWTGRLDNYGWSYDGGYGTGEFSWTRDTAATAVTDASGNSVATGDDVWTLFAEIMKDCNWTVTCAFTSQTAVNVTVTATANSGTYSGYTYTCAYTLNMATALDAINIHINSDGSIAGDVSVTSTATYVWS